MGAASAPALAQQPVRPPTSTTQAVKSAVPNNEQMLFSCLAIDNQSETIMARWAKTKAQSADVKAYATLLEKEHQACTDKLTKFSPQTLKAAQIQEALPEGNTSPGNGEASEDSSKVPFDMVALHREIAQQCFVDSKELLNEQDAKNFDAAFVGMQLAKHMAMKTKLTVFERHASENLKPYIAESLATTKRHLDQAKRIMSQITQEEIRVAKAGE